MSPIAGEKAISPITADDLAAISVLYYGLPTSWSDDVEEAIVAAVGRRVLADSRARPSATQGLERPRR